MRYGQILKRVGRFLPILILTLTFASSCNVSAETQPGYVRIKTGTKDVVYVEFRGTVMRVAHSEKELANAKAIKFAKQASRSGMYQTQFPEVALPLPLPRKPEPSSTTVKQPSIAQKDKKPSGPKTQPYVVFTLVSNRRGRGYALATIIHRTKDAKKATWEYLEELYTQPAATVDAADLLAIADMEKISLELTTRSAGRGRMGIAVEVKSSQVGAEPPKGAKERRVAAKSALSDIRKDKKSVKASVRVLDANGKEASSKKGALSDFAFG